MQLWKKLTEIYINKGDKEEILSILESLRDELKEKNFTEKEKLSEIIEKIKSSNNVNKVLEKQIWAEHFFYLTGTPLTGRG